MKKSLILAASIAASIASIASMADASAGNLWTMNNTPGNYQLLRSNPQGFFVGTIYAGQGFYQETYSTSGSNYLGGWAGGANCVWTNDNRSRLTLTSTSTYSVCAGLTPPVPGIGSRRYLTDHFAAVSNDYIPGTVFIPGITDGTFVKLKSATGFCGNFDNGKPGISGFRDCGGTPLPAGTTVYWRWISKDGLAAAVRIGSYWGFIYAPAIETPLIFADGKSYF